MSSQALPTWPLPNVTRPPELCSSPKRCWPVCSGFTAEPCASYLLFGDTSDVEGPYLPAKALGPGRRQLRTGQESFGWRT